jgi:hypothetical protein
MGIGMRLVMRMVMAMLVPIGMVMQSVIVGHAGSLAGVPRRRYIGCGGRGSGTRQTKFPASVAWPRPK